MLTADSSVCLDGTLFRRSRSTALRAHSARVDDGVVPALRQGLTSAAWYVFVLALLLLPALAHAWTSGLKEAAEAVAAGRASAAQEMMVFTHNKELNLMAQAGEIRDFAYAGSQSRFHETQKQVLDTTFKDSPYRADVSGAKLNPGTDTDVNVLRVDGKPLTLDDIRNIETRYQNSIRQHFPNAPQGRIDTNTDFLPHPGHTSPDEFRRIAEHINTNGGTAYTDPRAASAQAKLGNNASKITMEEAGSFSAEMKRLANTKMNAASDLRQKAAAARSSNPGEAQRLEAEALQYEYQAAKYHERMSGLNNHLREQYGLPANKGGGTFDKAIEDIRNIGRNPFSAGEIAKVRDLHPYAMRNSTDHLIDTMLEIAKKEPARLAEIRALVNAEIRTINTTAGSVQAVQRLEKAVKDIETAAKWAAFKQTAKNLSGWNATTKMSVAMTVGGAIVIGYQGVTITLNDVKATDTLWDFFRNAYYHAAWEGTGIGPAFEQAQREELERYMKEFESKADPSMVKHITFTVLKTGVYMGRDMIIGVLYLPDTIWEFFTQEKEMEAYAAMQNELAQVMRQMILDRQAYEQLMTRMRKMGLHDEDVKPFLNCMCRECGGMFGGYYDPAGKGEYGHGPCMCSGPLTIWKTPLPTGDKNKQYACFNQVTKMRYDEAQDIFNKWHQQALAENAKTVEKELQAIKDSFVNGKAMNDEETARRLADEFAAIQPLLLPKDVDDVRAMLGPYLANHAQRNVEAGNLGRAVDNLDRVLNKIGTRSAQEEANLKQTKAEYERWDKSWRETKDKRFPEIDALLSKRQIQRARGEIEGLNAQMRDPYARKLPPAIRDPDFLKLRGRLDDLQKSYSQSLADAWKRSSELQKVRDPRGAIPILEQELKGWEHPAETVSGLNGQLNYDRGLVVKADELRNQGQAFEEGGAVGQAIERYTQSLAIQRDEALEARVVKLKQVSTQAAVLWNEGKAQLDAGHPQEALAKFRDSVRLAPDAARQQYVRELEARLATEQQKQQHATALWNEGRRLFDTGSPAAALAKFKESIQIWANPANVRYANELEASLTAKRNRAQQLRNEGEALQAQNRIAEAIAKYRESLAQVPDPALESHIRQLEQALAAASRPTVVNPSPTAPVQKGNVVFNNGNIGGVGNAPTRPTTFNIGQPHVITLIQNYHWNNSRGAAVGTIGLRDQGGRVYGPWPVAGTPGQGGVPNAYWTARPNVTLPQGTYTVIDSDPASWSQNSESQGAGFTRVEGYPASGGPDVGAPVHGAYLKLDLAPFGVSTGRGGEIKHDGKVPIGGAPGGGSTSIPWLSSNVRHHKQSVQLRTGSFRANVVYVMADCAWWGEAMRDVPILGIRINGAMVKELVAGRNLWEWNMPWTPPAGSGSVKVRNIDFASTSTYVTRIAIPETDVNSVELVLMAQTKAEPSRADNQQIIQLWGVTLGHE